MVLAVERAVTLVLVALVALKVLAVGLLVLVRMRAGYY